MSTFSELFAVMRMERALGGYAKDPETAEAWYREEMSRIEKRGLNNLAQDVFTDNSKMLKTYAPRPGDPEFIGPVRDYDPPWFPF